MSITNTDALTETIVRFGANPSETKSALIQILKGIFPENNALIPAIDGYIFQIENASRRFVGPPVRARAATASKSHPLKYAEVKNLSRLAYRCIGFVSEKNMAVPKSYLPIPSMQAYLIRSVLHGIKNVTYTFHLSTHSLSVKSLDEKTAEKLYLIAPFVHEVKCEDSETREQLKMIFPDQLMGTLKRRSLEILADNLELNSEEQIKNSSPGEKGFFIRRALKGLKNVSHKLVGEAQHLTVTAWNKTIKKKLTQLGPLIDVINSKVDLIVFD